MTYQERSERLAAMLEEKHGIRGATLEKKLRRAGRLVPKHVRRGCEVVIDAARRQSSPKLARMVDDAKVVSAYRTCENYFADIDAWDLRKGRWISFLATNAFNILAVAAILIAVLVWRGFL